jgi:hypothetical protein
MTNNECLSETSDQYCGGRKYCAVGYVCGGDGCRKPNPNKETKIIKCDGVTTAWEAMDNTPGTVKIGFTTYLTIDFSNYRLKDGNHSFPAKIDTTNISVDFEFPGQHHRTYEIDRVTGKYQHRMFLLKTYSYHSEGQCDLLPAKKF